MPVTSTFWALYHLKVRILWLITLIIKLLPIWALLNKTEVRVSKIYTVTAWVCL